MNHNANPMKITAITPTKEIQQLKKKMEFASNTKLILIYGENATGKTFLYENMKNSIKSSLFHKKTLDIQTNFPNNAVNSDNDFLFFINEKILLIQKNLILNNLFADEEIHELCHIICRLFNERYLKRVIFSNNQFLLLDDNGINHDGIGGASEQYYFSLCLLIAIKEKLFPNSFLIFDTIPNRINERIKKKLIKLICDNSSQLVIFDHPLYLEELEHYAIDNSLGVQKYAIREFLNFGE